MEQLDKVIALIKLRFEALYGSNADEEYCRGIRDEVLEKFS